ncbi:cytochrome P450 [Nocardia sp. NPDC051570]|uniref:cytochrome P450 n=1 Tax=Nocardia sp. NPDC051570 TaxID=3364324 RepID=UPI0037939C74
MDTRVEPSPSAACPHFDPFDPAHIVDPYPTYATLRRDAPVFYHPHLDVWVVSRYADIVAAVNRPEIFSSSGSLTLTGGFSPSVEAVLAGGIGMASLLTETDGPTHTRIRAVSNRAFTQKRIAEMEPRIRAIADDLIERFEADSRAELVSQFASPLSGLVICDLFGLPRVDLPILRPWNEGFVSLLSVDVPTTEQIRCARGLLAYERYIHEQFLDRRSNPREDLLTVMLPSELGGTAALSLGEAVYNAMDFIAGGYETTAKTIANAVAALFEYRDQYDRINGDPESLDQAVEELLRFATPVQGIFRVTTRPVELGGVTLPPAARVFLLYASANHDEQQFDNPDVLDVSRPPTRNHLTFSRGTHVCLGSALVRLTVRSALETLQKRLPNLRPARDAAPRRVRHIWLNGYETLPVEWDQAAERAH